jgi:hypothetical protein
MEYYLAFKKDEIMVSASKWIELQIIKLGEVSQSQKDKSHIFFHMLNFIYQMSVHINTYMMW